MVKINKEKITLEEHYKLGKYLRIAVDKLTGELIKIKPKSIARTSFESKALKHINSARNLLEEIMFREYGNEGDSKFKKNWWQDIYYGTAGRRKKD